MTSLLGEDRKIAVSVESVVNQVETERVRLVRFLFCDTSGIIRGKAAHVDRLADRLRSGIGLVKGTMAMNMLDQMQTDTGYGATGEVRLFPDLETFSLLPYTVQSAGVICDLLEIDKTPSDLCPRSILKRQIAAAEAVGIRIEAAFEPEFTLGTIDADGQYKPIDDSLCFSTEGMNRAANFINRFMNALEKQGIEIEQYYPELGHGQHELSVRHAPALRACDQHILYRETLRGIAQEQGLHASLAPKPLGPKNPGNGCHLHLSAWGTKSGDNLFYNANEGISDTGKFFIAGLLRHLPALVSLTAPSVNSYRRLRPRTWASAYTCWGYENREAAVRVPTRYWGLESESSNIEIKCVDSTCNPYLAMAGIIAAGLAGVQMEQMPPPPVRVEPSTLSSAEQDKMSVKRLPSSLKESLKRLEKDDVIMDVLGKEYARLFLAVKQSEAAAFAESSAEEETAAHRFKF